MSKLTKALIEGYRAGISIEKPIEEAKEEWRELCTLAVLGLEAQEKALSLYAVGQGRKAREELGTVELILLDCKRLFRSLDKVDQSTKWEQMYDECDRAIRSLRAALSPSPTHPADIEIDLRSPVVERDVVSGFPIEYGEGRDASPPPAAPHGDSLGEEWKGTLKAVDWRNHQITISMFQGRGLPHSLGSPVVIRTLPPGTPSRESTPAGPGEEAQGAVGQEGGDREN